MLFVLKFKVLFILHRYLLALRDINLHFSADSVSVTLVTSLRLKSWVL